MRGTFANIRIMNLLLKNDDGSVVEGGFTIHQPSGEHMFIYDAAMRYQKEGKQLIVFSGKEYGTGSSRDWAAKGTTLLGVRAVVAESFERIHRSNLIGMGVLPLQFIDGQSWASLGLTGEEEVSIAGVAALGPRQKVTLQIKRAGGKTDAVEVQSRIDTENEVEYFRNGGILHDVLRGLAQSA
jgi:aconitate hydratase